MIVMRMHPVLGSCEVEPYGEKAFGPGGWFPLQSVDFRFNAGGDTSTARGTPPAAGRSAPQGQGAAAADAGQAFTAMQINKMVDMATVNLMELAMRCRKGPARSDEEQLVADIHFVGSVTSDKGVFTWSFLRIHLENVQIQEWGISGQGDDRPTESMSLLYDRAAMCYCATPDAKWRDPKIRFGWNQKKDEKWWPSTYNKYFENYPE